MDYTMVSENRPFVPQFRTKVFKKYGAQSLVENLAETEDPLWRNENTIWFKTHGDNMVSFFSVKNNFAIILRDNKHINFSWNLEPKISLAFRGLPLLDSFLFSEFSKVPY